MFELDDNFLNEIGLGELPDDQKKPFLQHIYQELEMRVGTKLSDGMSDDQLEEFGQIIEQKDNFIESWLAGNVPNYKNDKTFVKLQQSSGKSIDGKDLRAEYAATKWLEINRPDYREVVASVLDQIKQEIVASKDAILGKDLAA